MKNIGSFIFVILAVTLSLGIVEYNLSRNENEKNDSFSAEESEELDEVVENMLPERQIVLQELNMSMYSYIRACLNGENVGDYIYAEDYVTNYQDIIKLGAFDKDGTYYPVPTGFDDVQNALVLYFDECSVTIYKDDWKAEVVAYEDEVPVELDVLLLDDVESLYAIQYNYSQGMAPLMEIPYVMVENVYDHYHDLKIASIEHIPTLIREYAALNMVYLDYATGYSVRWDKNTDSIYVEPTDMKAFTDYMQKMHK